MNKGPEAAQQIDLLFAEPRNINEGFRSGQHGEQAQQQNLIKRVKHLAGLARVLQRFEMTQKYDSLAKRTQFPRCLPHRDPLYNESRGSRLIQHFRPLSPTRSPDCPAVDAACG
jgi:hypothetical protein